jgi:hypothetical protein
VCFKIIVISNPHPRQYPQTFKFKFQSRPLILGRCEFVGLAENIYNRLSALARQRAKVILLGAAIALPTTAILFFSSFFRAHFLEFKSKQILMMPPIAFPASIG